MFYYQYESSHDMAYAKQLFDYLTNQQQLCKTDAVVQIAEEMVTLRQLHVNPFFSML